MSRSAVAEHLPLSALLSQALVAFTIEIDNAWKSEMPHRTTRYGGPRRAPYATSLRQWSNFMRVLDEQGLAVAELRSLLEALAGADGAIEKWRYGQPGQAFERPRGLESRGMLIATHDGSFHADELFAIAALGLLHDPVEVVRTRDRDALAQADLRVDVGFRQNPSTGDFDHHQRDFDTARENGVRYASFGLVWRELGALVCDGDQNVAAAVDETLVQSVDANDTGQRLTQSLIDGVRPMTVNAIVGAFNARWDEALTPEEERERFDAALALAQDILAREVAAAASGRRSERIVREAISVAADPRVVELPVNAPWKQVLVPEAADALFVIYPKRQGFGLEAVPRELGSFENRRDLPATWGGLEGADLVAATGVEQALFCHAKRFLAVARSRTSIKQLAELALAER